MLSIVRVFAAIALAAFVIAAHAQYWPAKPLRVVVAFPPGGSTDIAVRARFALAGLEPVGGTPEQFAKLFRDDHEKYARLIKEFDIRLQ